MKNLSRTLGRNPVYFGGYLLFLGILIIFCLSLPKTNGFLLINQFHSLPFDHFFILFTNIGNGIFVIGLLLVLLLRKAFRWAIQIGTSFVASGLIVQLLKNLIYSPRPRMLLGAENIHILNGITRTGFSSFPSGHTATVFALTTLLAIYLPGRTSGFFFIMMATLTGFSRIYLSQHFPVDVLAGSGIGCMVSLYVYQFMPLTVFRKTVQKNEGGEQTVKLRQ